MTLPKVSVSEQLAAAFSAMPPTLPAAVADICDAVLMDVAGLCVAARNSDYVRAALRATREPGPARLSATPAPSTSPPRCNGTTRTARTTTIPSRAGRCTRGRDHPGRACRGRAAAGSQANDAGGIAGSVVPRASVAPKGARGVSSDRGVRRAGRGVWAWPRRCGSQHAVVQRAGHAGSMASHYRIPRRGAWTNACTRLGGAAAIAPRAWRRRVSPVRDAVRR